MVPEVQGERVRFENSVPQFVNQKGTNILQQTVAEHMASSVRPGIITQSHEFIFMLIKDTKVANSTKSFTAAAITKRKP